MDETAKSRLTLGLFVLLTAIILFFQLNGGQGFGQLWPLYLLLFGFSGLFNRSSWMLGGVLLIIGVFFLLRNFNIISGIPISYIWPGILLLFAVVIIAGAFAKRSGGELMKGQRNYTAFFGGTEDIIDNPDFKSLSLSAMFGGVDLDMTRAGIQGEEARIDVFVLFGGADLILPENWRVENRAISIFGGVENQSRASDDPDRKRVLLTGTVLFGGVTIKTR